MKQQSLFRGGVIGGFLGGGKGGGVGGLGGGGGGGGGGGTGGLGTEGGTTVTSVSLIVTRFLVCFRPDATKSISARVVQSATSFVPLHKKNYITSVICSHSCMTYCTF